MSRKGIFATIYSLEELRAIEKKVTSLAKSLGFSSIESENIREAFFEIGLFFLENESYLMIKIGTVHRQKTLKIMLEGHAILRALENLLSLSPEMHRGGLAHLPEIMDTFVTIPGDAGVLTISMRKHLALHNELVSYGIISKPYKLGTINGDNFLIKTFDGEKVLIALIDGAGRGDHAAALAANAKAYIGKHFRLPLPQLMQGCHERLKNSQLTGGVDLSLLLLEPEKIYYLGVGDTHVWLLDETFQKIANHEGKVGEYQLPSLETQIIPIYKPIKVALCSDGIMEHLKITDLELNAPTQLIAESIYEKYRRRSGDATVIALQYAP